MSRNHTKKSLLSSVQDGIDLLGSSVKHRAVFLQIPQFPSLGLQKYESPLFLGELAILVALGGGEDHASDLAAVAADLEHLVNESLHTSDHLRNIISTVIRITIRILRKFPGKLRNTHVNLQRLLID